MKTLFRVFNVMFFAVALVFAGASMVFAASLPDGLTELEYIEVTKSPVFINTNTIINEKNMPATYRQVLKASWVLTDTGTKQYCGADNFSLGVQGDKKQANIIVANAITGSQIQSGTLYTIDATYDIKQAKVSFVVDGKTTYTGKLLPDYKNETPFTVFADSGKNNAFLPGSRVYSYQLYIDDDLVVDLIPVQDTKGTVGMYDTVSRGLFERMGDGSFVPGPEVVDTSISQICTDMIVKEGLGTYYYDEVNSIQGKFTVAAVMQTVPNASSLLESVPETCTLKCQDPTLTFDFGALNRCMQGDASACSGICVDFVSENGPCRNNGEKYNYRGDCVMTTYRDSGIDLGSWAGFVDKTFGIPAGYVDASDYPHACPKLDNVKSDTDSGRCVCKDGWFDTTTGTCLDSFVIDFDDKTSMTVSLKNAPTTVASSSMGLFDTFGHVVFDSNGKYAYGISGDTNSYISTDVGNPGHVFASAGKSASSVSVVKIELLDEKGTVSQNIYYVPKGSDGNYYFMDEKLGKPLNGGVVKDIPKVTGYSFGGYFSQKNAGGTRYVDAKGAFASNWWDGSSLTVQMQPFYTANTITLDLRPEGSTVKTTTCTYDSSFVLPTPTERSGYTFNGWIMPDGKTYAAGTSVTCNNALLETDDGTTKSIGASWTPKSAPAGSCPGSFFDYTNQIWITDFTCKTLDDYVNDYNVLSDGCSCVCATDNGNAAFNPGAAVECMEGNNKACGNICLPLDEPCERGKQPYVGKDGKVQCGYYFDPDFGLIESYGDENWIEFLRNYDLKAGYVSLNGEVLPCAGEEVAEDDKTGMCICKDDGWFLMDGGVCVQELPVDLMLDSSGTQFYNSLSVDFGNPSFNLSDAGVSLPDGGTGLVLDQITDMVDGLGYQMFDNNGNWVYTQLGSGTEYIYKPVQPSLVGYPTYSNQSTYIVSFNANNGSGGQSTNVTATYGQAMPTISTTAPTLAGYTFAGWYDNATSGTKYYNANGTSARNWDKTTNTTLYAHWTAKTSTISFNANGGTGGQTANVTATYDQAMPAISTTAPTRSGHTFTGWYDNATSGTKYYNADGTSAKNWDKTANTTLYAQWSQDVITCAAGNYLPANSTTCATCPVGYYCPSTGNYVQSSSDQGKVACPTGYTANTATGRTSASQCQIQCSAGTRVAAVKAACTTPAGGWYTDAHVVNYGQISPVNYCMYGFSSSGTAASKHDASTDCTQSLSGQAVTAKTISARYIQVTTSGSTANQASHVAEIQAFVSHDGTGTNLLAGKTGVSGSNMTSATDGSWNRSPYASGTMIWDIGAATDIGSIKFALYTDGRTYHDVKVKVSKDRVNWTTVFSAENLLTQNSTIAKPEMIVLSAAPTDCTPGTYKASYTAELGSTYLCSTCPTTNPYSPAGAADAGACGRKLHIGDNVMYLRSTQKTTPSLKFDFNKDGVADLFGNMSTSSKNMSSGVDKSFKVNYGGQLYYIHDDTVQ